MDRLPDEALLAVFSFLPPLDVRSLNFTPLLGTEDGRQGGV
jgi:hypothetical protein